MNESRQTLTLKKPSGTYKVGRFSIAIFGGYELRAIVDPQGLTICTVMGSVEEANALVDRLNELAGLAKPTYAPNADTKA
jgi:hypothetical protein